MHRRLILLALLGAPVRRATADAPRPRHKVSAATLHQALSRRFPVRLGVPGFMQVEVSAPRLHLLPARNLLGAGLQAQALGAGAQAIPPGELDVAFALRYERSDRTLRAHRMDILDIHWPGIPPEAIGPLRGVLAGMAREAVGEIVLHAFEPRELALADTMGFEPDRLTVLGDGLQVDFAPKPTR